MTLQNFEISAPACCNLGEGRGSSLHRSIERFRLQWGAAGRVGGDGVRCAVGRGSSSRASFTGGWEGGFLRDLYDGSVDSRGGAGAELGSSPREEGARTEVHAEVDRFPPGCASNL